MQVPTPSGIASTSNQVSIAPSNVGTQVQVTGAVQNANSSQANPQNHKKGALNGNKRVQRVNNGRERRVVMRFRRKKRTSILKKSFSELSIM